jgi:hypothetical protein
MRGFAENAEKSSVERVVGKLQPEPLAVLSMGELSAAKKASGGAANTAHSWKLALAMATTIKKTRCNVADSQRQPMAGTLVL